MRKSDHRPRAEHTNTRCLGKNLLLSLLLFSSFSAYAASITARILGFENAEGQVVVTMYSAGNKALFPKNPGSADYLRTAGIREGEATLSIADVRPGVYAIFAFHDRNGNGLLDHKWYGTPAEPFGYYKVFKVKIMPPGFDDVSFEVTDSDMALEIPLQTY